jgi:ankyrin repeat protein
MCDDTASWLLAAGANPNAADRDGITPLRIAASRRKRPVVSALLGAGADPDKADSSGRTPREVGDAGVADLLPE